MMKIFYQGNNVHSLIGHGAAPETITVQGRVLKCTAFDSRYVHYSIPRGEYECQKVPNPFLFSETTFIALCGTPEGLVIGATLGSITQWSGEAWDEYEIKLFDEDSNQLLDDRGLYSMEKQSKRIADGTIQSNSVIARHNARMAGAPQATEYQDD